MNNTQKTQRIQQLKHTDPELWRQIKAAAIMDGKTMTEWVEEALIQRLAKATKLAKKGD